MTEGWHELLQVELDFRDLSVRKANIFLLTLKKMLHEIPSPNTRITSYFAVQRGET